MTAANFSKCLALVLKHEGGNDDDPQDPGGRTSRGITQRVYTSWLGEPKDVWKATDKEVKAIYKTQYWDPWCDRLPDGVDYEAFDMFVNMGPVQGARIIQRAVGVTADGHMGLVTLDAILGQSDKSAIIRQISDRRRAFYRSLRTFSHFGRGWLRRVDEVEQAALKMVVAEPIPQGIMSTDLPDTAPRASTEKADDKALNMTPETAGGASAGLGSVTATIDQIQQQLAPYSDTIRYVKYGLLLLTILAAGIAVWGLIKRNRAKDASN